MYIKHYTQHKISPDIINKGDFFFKTCFLLIALSNSILLAWIFWEGYDFNNA